MLVMWEEEMFKLASKTRQIQAVLRSSKCRVINRRWQTIPNIYNSTWTISLIRKSNNLENQLDDFEAWSRGLTVKMQTWTAE